MQIILIRHGSTSGNALKQYIGTTDESLSDEGRLQAVAAGGDKTVRQVWVVTPLGWFLPMSAAFFSGTYTSCERP